MSRMHIAFFPGSKRAILLRAAVLIAAIAALDWFVVGEIPLGFLYLLPMLMVGSVLEPWQIGAVAGLCTFLAEFFDDLAWNVRAGVPEMSSILRHSSGPVFSSARRAATGGSFCSTFTRSSARAKPAAKQRSN